MIGVEHEKFVFDIDTLDPAGFDGPRGIEALLKGMTRFGWTEILENGRTIGLSRGHANISLEPGGQLELSGAQFPTLHGIAEEVATHLAEAGEVAAGMGLGFLGLGYHPAASRDRIGFVPKGRYAIMRGYMPKVGSRGLDMMTRTCTAQVNLDFTGEADMVAKLRMALKLQPVATALFSNSPFAEGRAADNLDERAAVWLDVDPARTGSLPIAFEDGFGFERYVDYALDVPIYFVYREGRYIDVAGGSFRDFMAGKLAALRGEIPTISDWADHLTTVFTDVRLKRYIEMRGADVGLPLQIMAVAALWTGILYDSDALAEACELADEIPVADLPELRIAAAERSLENPRLLAAARRMVQIAKRGLVRRGPGEEHYLTLAEGCAERGVSPAMDLRKAWRDDWKRDINRVFDIARFR